MKIYTSEMKRTEVKNDAKKILINDIVEFLNTKYPDSYSQVKSGEFSIAIGKIDDKEVCVNLNITAKNYEDYIANTKSKTEYRAYDRQAEAMKYQMSLQNKNNQ